jgi:spermidine/putrescine transport system substrate-binding protein
MKRLAVVCLTVSLVVAFSLSCQAETLELLTWEGYAPKVLMDKFEKETGITVKPTYSNNEEIIAKLRATRGAGFDLAQPSQDRISSVQEKYKLYQPVDFARVDTAQIVPSMLEAVKKNTMVGGKSYAVPHVYGTSGLIVNRKYAADASDYKDLLNPVYTKAGSATGSNAHPDRHRLFHAAGSLCALRQPQSYKKLMERVGAKLIEGKGLVKNYWTNGDALLQSMRSEEVFVAMAWDNGGWKLHAENPDIDFVAPKSGALGWIDTFAIPAKAKNVDAAYKWINFMMKPENAAVFTNKEKYGTASAGAIEYYDAEVKANFKRSFSAADIDNIKWYPPVPAKLESIEGLILDKVKAAN